MEQYTCYAILLTEEETIKGVNLGYKFVKNNIDRAVPIPIEIGDRIFDKGVSKIVYNDAVYDVFRDYIILSESKRYYVCRPTRQPNDEV